MIITCPNCQTKYQVTYEAIGSAGRKVQCANCQKSWQQVPLPPEATPPAPEASPPAPETDPEEDRLFDAMDEDTLDEALEAEAEQQERPPKDKPEKSEPAESAQDGEAESAGEKSQKNDAKKGKGKASEADEQRRRQKAFSQRQTAMISSLPLARMRRSARLAGIVILAAIVGLGYFYRESFVEAFPEMAGVYAAIGLEVNVVGLELSHLETRRTMNEGKEVLVVSAQIVGVQPDPVPVPPVLVSLLDARGATVYEWTVAPRVHDLMVGERATFDTRLPLPPKTAVHVRLSFAGGHSMPRGMDAPATSEMPMKAADHAHMTPEPHAAAPHGDEPAPDTHPTPTHPTPAHH